MRAIHNITIKHSAVNCPTDSNLQQIVSIVFFFNISPSSHFSLFSLSSFRIHFIPKSFPIPSRRSHICCLRSGSHPTTITHDDAMSLLPVMMMMMTATDRFVCVLAFPQLLSAVGVLFISTPGAGDIDLVRQALVGKKNYTEPNVRRNIQRTH